MRGGMHLHMHERCLSPMCTVTKCHVHDAARLLGGTIAPGDHGARPMSAAAEGGHRELSTTTLPRHPQATEGPSWPVHSH